MKSIMEEGSSIAKAIEKGLEKAGNPKEFSVKIYEDAEKNFFGITTKPAKIAIFFDEGKEKRFGSEYAAQHQQNKPQYQKQNVSGANKQQPQKQVAQPVKQKQVQENQQKQAQKQKPVHEQKQVQKQEHGKQTNNANSANQASNQKPQNVAAKTTHEFINTEANLASKPLWTKEMVDAATVWLNEMLSKTEYANVKFDINSDKYYLKVNFASPICQDITKERQLFAGIALLLMQSIKKKFDSPFKGFKVILMRNEAN